jgi:hypothetical protein
LFLISFFDVLQQGERKKCDNKTAEVPSQPVKKAVTNSPHFFVSSCGAT